MPKRLAITISGAVSLGSYEGGVLYEVLAALAEHNAHPSTQARPDERIEVDVLTGASAGGMTAAIAAQKLLYEAPTLSPVSGNAFHRPWVQEADIAAMLQMAPDEPVGNSILSSNLIEEIARRSLTARYAPGPPPAAVRHAGSASELRLGLSLSNLNGVQYCLPLHPAGTFSYGTHEDAAIFRGLGPQQDRLGEWESIRSTAVACGAFPFAFRVKELARSASDYPGADPPSIPTPVRFAYTDGGVFQNEPLGMAKNLVDELDQHRDVDSRFYLFVSPSGRSPQRNLAFTAHGAEFLHMAGQLVGSIVEQAQFQDWIMARRTNERIREFDGVVEGLCSVIRDGTVTPQAVSALSAPIIAKMTGQPGIAAALPDHRNRLANQYAREAQALNAVLGASAVAAFLDGVLVLEAAAGLQQKEEMCIYAAVASAQELAGTGLHAFQGFFDVRYRQHDYDVGRIKARALIDQINADGKGLAPIRLSQWHAPPVDAALNGLQLEGVDRAEREKFKRQLANRVQETMKELHWNWFKRTAAGLFVGGAIDKVLSL